MKWIAHRPDSVGNTEMFQVEAALFGTKLLQKGASQPEDCHLAVTVANQQAKETTLTGIDRAVQLFYHCHLGPSD